MSERVVVLTGFPSNELARRVLMRLLEVETEARITCIVPERFLEQARDLLWNRPEQERERVSLLLGDAAAVDLGLSGAEYIELAARVQAIHHCAAVTYTGAALSLAERVNVGATYEVLELARTAKQLERVVHWSTLAATGDRHGVVLENDLVEPRASRLVHTRYRAEKMIAKMREEVPVTVLRPSMLVGDSRTGKLARLEGAHLLISGLLTAPRDVAVPRPGRGEAPLQVVPIDYAVEAGVTIARAKDTVGRTFHIIDPTPPSLHEALTMIADIVGKPPPRGGFPHPITQAIMRLPGVSQLVHAQRALVEDLGRDVRYDDANAEPILSRAGLSCPPFASYVDKLVSHVERARKSDRPPAPAQPGLR